MGFLGKLRRGKWNPFNRRKGPDRREIKPSLFFGPEGSMFKAETPKGEITGKNRRINVWRGRRKTDRKPHS